MSKCIVCEKENVLGVVSALNRGGRNACLCPTCATKNKAFTPKGFSLLQGKEAKHGIRGQASFKIVCNDVQAVRYEFTKLNCKWIPLNKNTAVVLTPVYCRFNKLSCVRELVGILEKKDAIKKHSDGLVSYTNRLNQAVDYDLFTAPLDAKYIKF